MQAVVEALRDVAERMGDPDRVVLHTFDFFEQADGGPIAANGEVVAGPSAADSEDGDPARACFKGAVMLACRDHALSEDDRHLLYGFLGADHLDATEVLTVHLREGRAAEVAEAALRSAELYGAAGRRWARVEVVVSA